MGQPKEDGSKVFEGFQPGKKLGKVRSGVTSGPEKKQNWSSVAMV